MRVLILLAAVVMLLAIIGWITFSSGAGRASINVETERVRQDTQKVLESGSEVLQDAGEAVDAKNTSDKSREPIR